MQKAKKVDGRLTIKEIIRATVGKDGGESHSKAKEKGTMIIVTITIHIIIKAKAKEGRREVCTA